MRCGRCDMEKEHRNFDDCIQDLRTRVAELEAIVKAGEIPATKVDHVTITQAVNATCSCGGRPMSDPEHCLACEVLWRIVDELAFRDAIGEEG